MTVFSGFRQESRQKKNYQGLILCYISRIFGIRGTRFSKLSFGYCLFIVVGVVPTLNTADWIVAALTTVLPKYGL